MAALCSRCGHYIFILRFLLSSFFPQRSEIGLSANLECRSEMCCAQLTENTGRKNRQKLPSGHHPTTLSGYIFATKACIDNREKNFNRFRVLAALLHGTLVVGVSQTWRRRTEGATYIWQGGHHVGRWPTFLVLKII